MAPRAQLWGQRFGELTAIKAVGSDRGVQWLCRCDCGARVTRSAGQLLQSRRLGLVSSCLECWTELRRGRYQYSVGPMRRQIWRELWEDWRTLYSPGAEAALTALVRAAVAREEGWAPEEEIGVPDRAEPGWVPPVRNGPAMTLEEIGAVLGESRERARRLEARALRKLRVALKGTGPPCETTKKKPPPPKLTPSEIAAAVERHEQWLADKGRRERARSAWTSLFDG